MHQSLEQRRYCSPGGHNASDWWDHPGFLQRSSSTTFFHYRSPPPPRQPSICLYFLSSCNSFFHRRRFGCTRARYNRRRVTACPICISRSKSGRPRRFPICHWYLFSRSPHVFPRLPYHRWFYRWIYIYWEEMLPLWISCKHYYLDFWKRKSNFKQMQRRF